MRFRAAVAYVGTFFHGWQVQDNAARTVQAVLEEELRHFSGEAVRVHASGRTDAGVHADGQVVHFDAPDRPPDGLVAWVNRRLPWDLRMLEASEAAPDFHARSDARAKLYVYRFSRERVIPPSRVLFVAPLSPRADPAVMAQAAARIEGAHDFLPFSTAGTDTETTRRTVFACRVEETGPEVSISLTADGFLRGMARAIAGTLADVGRARWPPSRIDEIFEKNDKSLVADKAKPRGLTLREVFYGKPE